VLKEGREERRVLFVLQIHSNTTYPQNQFRNYGAVYPKGDFHRGDVFCRSEVGFSIKSRYQTTTSFSRWITLKKINYIDEEGQEVNLKQCRMSIFSSTLKRGYGNAPRGKPADPLESMVSLQQITLNSSNLRYFSGRNTRPPALQGQCFPIIYRYN
jgi:hypothetical protein